MKSQPSIPYLKISLLSTAMLTSLALTACSSSSSSGSSHTPVKQEQSITFTAPATMAVGDSSELTATASSDLDVTYKATTPTICTVEEAMVTAIAKGDCKITASQAGSTGFKPAEDVMVSIPVVSATLEVMAENLAANQAGTITLSGKPVSEGITAMLGDNELAVTVSDDYTANIPVTAAQLTMAGDIPLTIKKGDDTLYEAVINVALPDATGDVYTVKKTGITTCGNATDNSLDCSNETALGDYYQTNQDGEVQAGANMTYTKVAHQAERDGDKVMEYCVYDNVSGLLWEQKTDDDGLRDKDWKYTWYDSNSATNGGVAGVDAPESDTCNGTLAKCNTENYINKLNAMNYCGHNDWRMPTDIELVGIRDFGKTEAPFIDPIFEHIAVGAEDDMAQGLYHTSVSHALPQAQISSGSQQYTLGNFSKGSIPLIVNYKNAHGNHILAVRNNP